MGTPAFYWLGARETWIGGDYLKTLDNLDRSMKGSDEHKAEALPWSLTLTAGLVKSYVELADTFETGTKMAKANASVFRKNMTDYRRLARSLSLAFAEKYRQFEGVKDAEIPLAFPFPSGTQAQPPLLTRVANGFLPQPADMEATTKSMMQRGVILAASRATGSGEDSSKAQEMLKAGAIKVPRSAFMLAMAYALHEQAELFGPKKLDEPQMMQTFAEEASHAIQGLPESKEVKSLSEKIQKMIKGSKKA